MNVFYNEMIKKRVTETSAGIQKETRRNIRFEVSNSGADDKWRKYSRRDWVVAKSIRRECDTIWRADVNNPRCFPPLEGEEEDRELERRREQVCYKNRRREENWRDPSIKSYRDRLGPWEIKERKKRLNLQSWEFHNLQVPILISSDSVINFKHKLTSLIYIVWQN